MRSDINIGRLRIWWHQQWSGVFRPWTMNWINFTLIHAHIEHAPYKTSNEFEFGLLGLHIGADWYYGDDECSADSASGDSDGKNL